MPSFVKLSQLGYLSQRASSNQSQLEHLLTKEMNTHAHYSLAQFESISRTGFYDHIP